MLAYHCYLPLNKKKPDAPLADAGGCDFHYSPQYRRFGQNKQHTAHFDFITALPVVELEIQFVLRAALQESCGTSMNVLCKSSSENHRYQ